ncbi:MAG TPA: AmmeMemoRadiSam system radical SAM enzyme [Nitrospiraceae bacterium]|jgi:pyruvate formate lyase activating enzyme|nr:AmmeMemoRadiSam system radical SAM enzyme [Nitrospiraceae bacterium]
MQLSPPDNSFQAALYYESLPDGRVRCTLCPHECKIAPGHRGACGVRLNRRGKLFTLVGARIVSAELDPIEKKPLFHFLPGSRAYSISTVGCNFRCRFCQNWEISQWSKTGGGIDREEEESHGPEPDELERQRVVGHPPGVFCPRQDAPANDWVPGRPVTPSDLVKEAQRCGAASLAYTYTEPTIFYELALATARAASAAGLGNVFVTNGFIALEPLREVAAYLNAANIDLKSFRDSFYRKICGGRLQPVLAAIQEYKKLGVWIELTTLLIPGLNDGAGELREMAAFIRTALGEDVPWHLSRFYPASKMDDRSLTPVSTLRRARDIGREAGLRYVYLGNVPEEEGAADTACPWCGAVVIRRQRFAVVENALQAGRCPRCTQVLAGRWASAS